MNTREQPENQIEIQNTISQQVDISINSVEQAIKISRLAWRKINLKILYGRIDLKTTAQAILL